MLGPFRIRTFRPSHQVDLLSLSGQMYCVGNLDSNVSFPNNAK